MVHLFHGLFFWCLDVFSGFDHVFAKFVRFFIVSIVFFGVFERLQG